MNSRSFKLGALGVGLAVGLASAAAQTGAGAVGEATKLVPQFDKDGDHHLNTTERQAAREFLRTHRVPTSPAPKKDKPGPSPGPKLSPTDVRSFPKAPLYDAQVLRTFFLEFPNADWEQELTDFHHTDVEVPAKLTVDGRAYREVGVHFRGASSFAKIGAGRKQSLGLSLDLVEDEQELSGYRTINLLNSHGDPTFLRTVLYLRIARDYVPAPQANLARVAISGESWGVYVNAQQFNKDFLRDAFRTIKGARWKVSGQGSLNYLGAGVPDYQRIYELKSKDDPKARADLLKLCQVLKDTPADQLEKALEPRLDVDGTLKLLALENVLVNRDGQWNRGTDYNLYQDERGRFHLIPDSADDTFRLPESTGRKSDGKAKRVQLDPLAGADDPQKPLLSKLLAAPSLRSRYLGYVRVIAEQSLDWTKLGPIAQQYHALIADDVKTDMRKLGSLDAFTKGVTNLQTFAEQRRAFLLNHSAVKAAGGPTAKPLAK